MSIEFKGIEELEAKLDSLTDRARVKAALGQACALVERSAIQNAPKGNSRLRGSITSMVEMDGEDAKGVVYTPLEYAPYVEYGTGAFREQNPVPGYWIYVKGSGSSDRATSSKRYTLEEAKQIVAIMKSEGLDAVYTNGRAPHPFMRPALDENRELILRILKESLLGD